MADTDTHRNVLSLPTATVPASDSPPPRVAARARVAATQRKQPHRTQTGNTPRRGLGRALARWWVWTARPVSLRAMWRLSGLNRARVPLGSGPLTALWRLSNGTDRLIMFVLALAAPTVLTGPLRWLATRPTRRFAFYLLTAVCVVASRLR
jgi:hypothetical protein